MRVLLTGATGFVGSALVPELLGAGHRVVGLTRSDAGADALARAGAEVARAGAEVARAGAEVVRGDVNDLPRLRRAAAEADGVIHAAFDHDHAKAAQSSEDDRKVIETLGEALSGSDRPLVVTSGTGLVRSRTGGPAAETDGHVGSAEFPRAASEEAADALIERGARVMVLRLPQVHDTRRQGRISWHIELAREKGWVAYIGEGLNRLPAVHVSDAVRLYRLALERGRPGARYHAVAEEGVPMRDIAAAIGAGLKLPVRAVAPDEALGYFGWMAPLAGLDLAASGTLTRSWLGWTPAGPDLLTDLRGLDRPAV